MSWYRRLLLGTNPRRTLLRALVWGLGAFLIVGFVAQPVVTRGVSMEPTYRDGTIHLVNLLLFRFRDPRRGDVVAIQMVGGRTYYLKRILAIPGDKVSFSNGVLIINGAHVKEPYIRTACNWSLPEIALGPGEFFVAGDNREGPIETHLAGIVRRERIVGGLWF